MYDRFGGNCQCGSYGCYAGNAGNACASKRGGPRRYVGGCKCGGRTGHVGCRCGSHGGGCNCGFHDDYGCGKWGGHGCDEDYDYGLAPIGCCVKGSTNCGCQRTGSGSNCCCIIIIILLLLCCCGSGFGGGFGGFGGFGSIGKIFGGGLSKGFGGGSPVEKNPQA